MTRRPREAGGGAPQTGSLTEFIAHEKARDPAFAAEFDRLQALRTVDPIADLRARMRREQADAEHDERPTTRPSLVAAGVYRRRA